MSNKLVLSERLRGSNLSDLTKRGLIPSRDIKDLHTMARHGKARTKSTTELLKDKIKSTEMKPKKRKLPNTIGLKVVDGGKPFGEQSPFAK
jgi:hypothetical protein